MDLVLEDDEGWFAGWVEVHVGVWVDWVGEVTVSDGLDDLDEGDRVKWDGVVEVCDGWVDLDAIGWTERVGEA